MLYIPPVDFDVLAIEEEDGGRNEGDVKVSFPFIAPLNITSTARQ